MVEFKRSGHLATLIINIFMLCCGLLITQVFNVGSAKWLLQDCA
ncbi:hypothetical protein HMPREF9444_00142 [Succinatimonas hippei YIT 12066]|uniref:Uncharacterized protein n=1 Tax=Succinatimonas hippei (strain DSM 22608 / JCM 16073 / KCTC 15190 / YIT 12066) TaxID=762983 RepID=E8LHM7_SUCHY|nr:hypothetical protein HMPREF9444_00142 [Succinatimonas hippei YIT 12066]